MPKQKKAATPRTAAARSNGSETAAADPGNLQAMSTQALRLLLGQHHLQQTGNRRELISRLEGQLREERQPQQTNASQPNNVPTGGMPQTELAELIAAIVESKIQNMSQTSQIQDGGANSNNRNTRPNLPATGQSI